MKNETDSGRTLVEMLGVLAMAGVLSVMGVMGYRLALDKNKANTLVNQAQQRAVIVMEQMTLNRPPSLQEFSSLNKNAFIQKNSIFTGPLDKRPPKV